MSGRLALSLVVVLASPVMSVAQDSDPCEGWQLQGYRIGMDKSDALQVHPVKKRLKPGSMTWKYLIREHAAVHRARDPAAGGYEIFAIKNEPPDIARYLIVKEGKVDMYRTSKPQTPNEIVRAITTALGEPTWLGDRSTEFMGMGTLAKWENPECNTVVTVSRVTTMRVSKTLLFEMGSNPASDTQITLSSYEREVEAGNSVLD